MINKQLIMFLALISLFFTSTSTGFVTAKGTIINRDSKPTKSHILINFCDSAETVLKVLEFWLKCHNHS